MGFLDTTQHVKPDLLPGANKAIKKILGGGGLGKELKKGPSVYTGSTVTPFSDQTTGALTGLSALAGANSGGAGLSGNAQKIIDNGGFTDGQLDTLGGMRDLSKSAYFDEMINGDGLTADQRLVQDRNRGIMTSEFDINANPAYAAVRDRALKEAQMGIDAQAAKAGRYGGASSQTIAARERGNLAADMDLGEYRNWQQRADNAATGLAALSQQGVGNRSGAITQKSGLQGALFNAENAGLDNMTRAFSAAQQPYLAQRAVGQEYENLAAQKTADDLRKFQEGDRLNWLSRAMQVATGAPAGQATTSSPSWANILGGGALGLAALGSGMFGMGGATGGTA